MKLGATTHLAFSALFRNKMRSLLTTLGIVIGVAAVVMMQSMGSGATTYVGDAISGLGSNMLVAVPGAGKLGSPTMTLGVPLFTLTDLEVIRRDAHDVAHVAAVNSRMLRVVYGASNRSTNVAGVSTEYFDIRTWGVSEGRMLGPDDDRQAALSCLIGQTVKDDLFLGQSPVDQVIRIHDVPCRVVGVLESKGSSAFGVDQDDGIFMPYTTFSRRIIGNERVAVMMASAVSLDRMDDAKDEIVAILRRRRHILPGEDDDFAVRDPREIQALLQSVTGMLTTLLAGVAAISLLVGGIGIMNIMLVSVTERTREIGIRRAVGACASDILTQFVVEATILSAVGGAIGLVLGLAGAFAVAHAIHIPFVVPALAGPIAFGVSVVVGIVFGAFPARKAARLDPLAALRYE